MRQGESARYRKSVQWVYSPHIPRRGAPQAPQGPGSGEEVLSDAPATAKVERSLSTRELSHFRQVTELSPFDLTIRSKVVPHSRHRYSKMGILSSLAFLAPCDVTIPKTGATIQPLPLRTSIRVLAPGCFSLRPCFAANRWPFGTPTASTWNSRHSVPGGTGPLLQPHFFCLIVRFGCGESAVKSLDSRRLIA